MSISKNEVEHVALLARLQLFEDEVDSYTKELNAILAWVEELDRLDVSKVEPTAHVLPTYNVFREDCAGESLPVNKALANAPDTKDTFFRVPKIV